MTPWELVKSDLYRHTGHISNKLLVKNLLNNNRSFKYTFWWRLASSKNIIVRSISRYMHRHLSIKYQIQIPRLANIGPGLYLGHATSVIIHPTVNIGRNCNLSQFTTIGSNYGKAATIGNNVYIGPNVCIVEDVTIGDCVTVGAGSVVVNNIADYMTAVGNPAKTIEKKLDGRFVKRQFKETTSK